MSELNKVSDRYRTLFWEYEEGVHVPIKRLNVCCGKKILKNYDNADINIMHPSAIKFDCTKAWPIDSDIYDEVYGRHCIEHFTPTDAKLIISEAYRVLVPGGTLYITCPNLEYITWKVNDTDSKKRDIFMAFYFGWQSKNFNPLWDTHKWGYTFDTLKELLKKNKFVSIKNLTNRIESREFENKKFFGGIIPKDTSHHLEVIGMKPKEKKMRECDV